MKAQGKPKKSSIKAKSGKELYDKFTSKYFSFKLLGVIPTPYLFPDFPDTEIAEIDENIIIILQKKLRIFMIKNYDIRNDLEINRKNNAIDTETDKEINRNMYILPHFSESENIPGQMFVNHKTQELLVFCRISKDAETQKIIKISFLELKKYFLKQNFIFEFNKMRTMSYYITIISIIKVTLKINIKIFNN